MVDRNRRVDADAFTINYDQQIEISRFLFTVGKQPANGIPSPNLFGLDRFFITLQIKSSHYTIDRETPAKVSKVTSRMPSPRVGISSSERYPYFQRL